MLNFDIQNHKPLREMVYEELKMQILKGSIIPGTRMMEVELAEEMGVSRTPIREAIRKLEKEGLVTIEPRRGAYASMISTEDMVEILEVRQDLEGLAAYFAADRMTEDKMEELRKESDSYNDAVKRGNMEDMDKWPGSDWTSVGAPLMETVKVEKDYGGADDLSGRLRTLWDDTNLYVVAEVKDDVFTHPPKTPEVAFIRSAMASVADTCVIPIQDYLGLGHEARINTPSTLGDNWMWRLQPGQLTPELAQEIRRMTKLYGRL